MKALGTILPSEKSLQINDDFERKLKASQAFYAFGHPILRDCEATHEEGEVRYYTTQSCFAIVSRSLKVLWFEIRKDGTYSVPNPQF